ncbi:MAG TPA: hypothetical protein VGU66_19695 [Candidatus Elarobacter sp.]|nr:hypothetical protein [Candidatus Elarobacter sp.]
MNASDFERESYRVDEQIWSSLALRTGERALFLGVANDGAWIARAIEIGVDVTVVVTSDAAIALIEKLGATAMRGSATMIPATTNAYDIAVAMHYLHEIDPGFHAQVVGELARVAKRVAIVEPSPPADALGKRIAALYARAKRDAGQFEGYQPIEYWRKLLASVKADVYQNLVTFTRVPPKEAVAETVSLILDAMVIEEMPKEYLDELRALAAHRDAQLLPLSRIVLVGTAAGVPIPQGSGAAFRPNVTPAPPPPAAQAPAALAPAPPPPAPANPYSPTAPQPALGFGFAPDRPPLPPGASPPLPPNQHAAGPQPGFSSGPAAQPPPAPPAGAPFGAPFALPEDPGDEAPFGGGAEPRTGFGWAWEPPEEEPPP